MVGQSKVRTNRTRGEFMSSNVSSASAVEGRTGEKCKVSGVYKCKTHPTNTAPIAIHNVFPPCSWGGGHATTWVLVQKA